MNSLKEIHEKIIEDLDKKDRLSKRIFGSNGFFTKTSDLNDSKPISTTADFKIFKPSKPFLFFGILLLVAAWGFIFYCIATQEHLNQGALGIVMFVLFFLTINILWQLFYDPSVIFTLRIDHFGIGTEDQFFQWSQIIETSILRIPQGKGYTEYLIIILSDGDYWSFNLLNFYSLLGIRKNLSKWVEYYKSPRD
jgi:hypothetical protein